MSFDKELTHLVEQQISARTSGGTGGAGDYGRTRNTTSDSRFEALEANLQRLADEFTKFVKSQKKTQRVEYGLEVIALHDFRLAVTAGRAIFIDLSEPIDLPYTYLQLLPAGQEREIRYIYLDQTGLILESTTDPSNMGSEYIPLAVIDVWANATEITQGRIKDIRPRGSGDNSTSAGAPDQSQLVGNATLEFPDTGNDSFIVSATSPASLKVNVSSGRALVDGEIIDAPGGVIDLTAHRTITKELVGFGDGTKKTFALYHKNVANVEVFVSGTKTTTTVDAANGQITFAAAPGAGQTITAYYSFNGNYLLVFLVEKATTEAGQSFGVIGWKAGSNRTPDQAAELPEYQHAIAKVDMSGSITAITNLLIDNSYEVKNLTQYDLQYGGNLGENSLQDGAITTDKIAANTITGDKIAANTITGNKIVASTITGDKIIAGSIDTANIKAGAITTQLIATGAITANEMATNSITIGKMDAATQNIINTANTTANAANSSVSNWKYSNTTYIDGGKIYTGSITANQIATNSITISKMDAEAQNKISTAQTTADTAKTNAAAAQTTANTANTIANAVNGTVNSWKYNNTTYIDGGTIQTGSIKAEHISAGTITADRIMANTITAENLSDEASGAKLFDQPGTYTWTVPKGVKRVWVSMSGGGGGGGCGGYEGAGYGGGGGGAAAYFAKEITVVPYSPIAVTVGSGGAGGNRIAVIGTTGGTTSFGTFLSCAGGGGGNGSNGNGGAAGGQGASGGSQGNVATGGNSLFGHGGSPIAGVGRNGTGYGSGGCGYNLAGNTGATGASGFVLIEW